MFIQYWCARYTVSISNEACTSEPAGRSPAIRLSKVTSLPECLIAKSRSIASAS